MVTANNQFKMSHSFNVPQRHCLHIMFTHYPEATWPDRGRIFNEIFQTNLTYTRIRDEYGGHKAGKRDQPGGAKPSRSLQWNDHICLDEFGLGPYSPQQVQDRRNMLIQIQAAITRLGLDRTQGLMAVNVTVGMIRADNNIVAGPALGAAGTNPAPAPAASTAAPSSSALGGQAAASSSTTTGPSVGHSTDPARGGRPFYHSREFAPHESLGGHFSYKPVQGLPYGATPEKTYRRMVEFSPGVIVQAQACEFGSCTVCKTRGRR